jgi:hypothetical protein
MMTDSQGLIDRYLKELERELSALPRARRHEVMDDVRAHISEARSQAGNDEAAVRELLDRLGDPTEIAEDARERFGVRQVKVGFMEVGALILLPVGGLILPFVGWFIGVALLWVSPAWNTRDKVIGTLFTPGGYLTTFYAFFMSMSPSTAPRPSGLEELWLMLVAGYFLIGPLASAIYLGYRLRHRPAASA